MAGNTGYPDVGNSDPMQGPAQISDLGAHFDDILSETVPTASALPSSGNWLKRMLLTDDTHTLYICTALPGTWRKVQAAPFAIEAQTTSVLVSTGANNIVTVNFTSGIFTQAPIVVATVAASPGTARKVLAQVTGVSAAGFQLVLATGDNTVPSPNPTIPVNWIAIQLFQSAANGAA